MSIPNPDFPQTTTDASGINYFQRLDLPPQPETVITSVTICCEPRRKKKGYKAWYPHCKDIVGKGKTYHDAIQDLINKASQSGL